MHLLKIELFVELRQGGIGYLFILGRGRSGLLLEKGLLHLEVVHIMVRTNAYLLGFGEDCGTHGQSFAQEQLTTLLDNMDTPSLL